MSTNFAHLRGYDKQLFRLDLLAQVLAPGAGLPEHGQGLGQGPPLLTGAVAARLLRSSTAGR